MERLLWDSVIDQVNNLKKKRAVRQTQLPSCASGLQVGGEQSCMPTGVAIDCQDNLYVAGFMASNKGFVRKYSGAGGLLWTLGPADLAWKLADQVLLHFTVFQRDPRSRLRLPNYREMRETLFT